VLLDEMKRSKLAITPGRYAEATCRQCGHMWIEGVWTAASPSKIESRYFCSICNTPPPHPLTITRVETRGGELILTPDALTRPGSPHDKTQPSLFGESQE
jgi:hypothetical protein